MAHALLGISRTSKRLSAPSLAEQTDDGSVSFATTSMSASSNNNSLSLRHQYSIASTSSTLYTCSEEDEHYYNGNDEVGEDAIDDLAMAACEEVIQDSRLNGAGLPIPWQHTQASHAPAASTSASNNSPVRKHRERAANHAMRFKRRGGSSRASLTTLGEDWHPRTSSAPELEHSPSKTSLYSLETAPRKTSLPDCTCHLESTDRSEPVEDEDPGGVVLSIDDQLDRMISMTSDLLRVSKGVLASSKRVSVTKASESQVSPEMLCLLFASFSG